MDFNPAARNPCWAAVAVRARSTGMADGCAFRAGRPAPRFFHPI